MTNDVKLGQLYRFEDRLWMVLEYCDDGGVAECIFIYSGTSRMRVGERLHFHVNDPCGRQGRCGLAPGVLVA